jgi:hypothetical protein
MALFLLVLLAPGCDGDSKDGSDGNTFDDTSGSCIDPSATITAPADGATVIEGEVVELEGDVSSFNEEKMHLNILWGVDGDVVGTGTTATWTAAGAGKHVIEMQANDDCGVGADDISVTVEASGG